MYEIQKFQLMPNRPLLKAVLKGLISFIPGFSYAILQNKKKSKHSGSNSEFCYSLWLSILIYLKENKINLNLNSIAEIGTGGSIGVGVCSLLTGCKKYYAFEIEETFDVDQNLKLFDEIVMLFKNKTSISDKFSQINIKIDCYSYPEDIINPKFLQESFVSEIRNDIATQFKNSKRIRIISNWEFQPSLQLDFIFSRAVMEHVKDPEYVYKGIRNHLKVNSIMLHDIEFHSHGLTKSINGHYDIPNYIWNLIYGRRKFFLNRWNLKNHENSIISNSFEIIDIKENFRENEASNGKIRYGAIVLAKRIA